ncbi:MAG: sigma-70 family RNA polymerase sigma factor [Streptosporangiales bacterium]|nr:sigma-70 family RNA polymerase sigma factor [Streptosporangiales bacterium]
MSDLATADVPAGAEELERYRIELTGYCYRMLGTAFEADDAVQETIVRAWRGLDGFEGRSSLRSWLYRIATNVCFTMLEGRKRRASPMDLGPASTWQSSLNEPLPEATWIGPVPDDRVISPTADPAEQAVARDSLRLAVIAALQHLPPRQRAVLILREVLRWQATEVAELLGTSVASVNSALQRARATIASTSPSDGDEPVPMSGDQQELLTRYLQAFERYDLNALVALLHEEATLSMPPFDLWVRGVDDILGWWNGPGHACSGSKLVPVSANGMVAFGQYRPSGPDGEHEPFALQVLQFTQGGKLLEYHAFLDTERVFPLFGLPWNPPSNHPMFQRA